MLVADRSSNANLQRYSPLEQPVKHGQHASSQAFRWSTLLRRDSAHLQSLRRKR